MLKGRNQRVQFLGAVRICLISAVSTRQFVRDF